MEVKELPLKFGINKSFRINPIDPDDYLKKLLTKNLVSFDGFKIAKNSYLNFRTLRTNTKFIRYRRIF